MPGTERELLVLELAHRMMRTRRGGGGQTTRLASDWMIEAAGLFGVIRALRVDDGLPPKQVVAEVRRGFPECLAMYDPDEQAELLESVEHVAGRL